MIFVQSWLFREKVLPLHTEKCGNSSVGRALASQAEGRGFEPRLPLNKPGHLVYGLRCEGRVGQVLLNPRADMTVIILTLVIIGYIFIATEAFTHINKAAVAVFVGVAAWLLYMLTGDSYVKAEHRDDFMMFVLGGGKSFNAYVAKNIFSKYRCVRSGALSVGNARHYRGVERKWLLQFLKPRVAHTPPRKIDLVSGIYHIYYIGKSRQSLHNGNDACCDA